MLETIANAYADCVDRYIIDSAVARMQRSAIREGAKCPLVERCHTLRIFIVPTLLRGNDKR